MSLPVTVEPNRYATAKRDLVGSVAFSHMPRVAEYLRDLNGSVHVEMHFAHDEQNRVAIDLTVSADLPLTCQRCLQAMTYPLKSHHIITPIAHESEAARLPENYEPVMLEEDFISPVAIVEEELILNIPLIPMHNEADCPHAENSAYYGAKEVEAEPSLKPFAGLAELKKKLK